MVGGGEGSGTCTFTSFGSRMYQDKILEFSLQHAYSFILYVHVSCTVFVQHTHTALPYIHVSLVKFGAAV